MQKLEIKGGKKISGTIRVSGSKNATLPILVSTILTNKKVIIKNKSLCCILRSRLFQLPGGIQLNSNSRQ